MKTWKNDNLLKSFKEMFEEEPKEYLEDLKKLIAGEFVASWQYEQAYKSIMGNSNLSYLQDHFSEHAGEEKDHYETLVDSLLERGGTPFLGLVESVQNALPPTEELTSNDCEYLKNFFIKSENAAVDVYTEFYDKIKDTDTELADIINGIISDEKGHSLDFQKLDGKVVAQNMDNNPEEEANESDSREKEDKSDPITDNSNSGKELGESKLFKGKRFKEWCQGLNIKDDEKSIWAAYDALLKKLGGNELARQFAYSLLDGGLDNLQAHLEYLCYNNHIKGDFIYYDDDYEDDEDYDESNKINKKKVIKEAKGSKKLKESRTEFIEVKAIREGYSPRQCRTTFTVDEFIRCLDGFNSNLPVYLSRDNGYSFGAITKDVIDYDTYDDSDSEDSDYATSRVECVVIKDKDYGYSPSQCREALTVDELIKCLNYFDGAAPVYIKIRDVYGSINDNRVDYDSYDDGNGDDDLEESKKLNRKRIREEEEEYIDIEPPEGLEFSSKYYPTDIIYKGRFLGTLYHNGVFSYYHELPEEVENYLLEMGYILKSHGEMAERDREKEYESKKSSKKIHEGNWKKTVSPMLSRRFYSVINADEIDYEAIRQVLIDILNFAKKTAGENFYEEDLIDDLNYADLNDEESVNFYINEMYDVLDSLRIWMEPYNENKKKSQSTKLRESFEQGDLVKIKAEWIGPHENPEELYVVMTKPGDRSMNRCDITAVRALKDPFPGRETVSYDMLVGTGEKLEG